MAGKGMLKPLNGTNSNPNPRLFDGRASTS